MTEMVNNWIKKYCYKATMVDRTPFGDVAMRFLEPKNIIGRLYSWYKENDRQRKV